MSVARHADGARWPEYRCPDHGAVLVPTSRALRCPEGHEYPVVDAIPRFVPADSYADAFGLQWNRFRRTQLDSHSGTDISASRLRRCLGERLWRELEGLQTLECGCGAGRFTEVLLQRGAAVTSVDLSSAVAANQDNCPQGERHRIAQADIRRLPFEPRRFDVVICLGVVQHTPSPEETVVALAEQVRPGGWLVIDHYTYSLSWFTKTAPLARHVLKRLPPRTALRAIERMVSALWPAHRIAARIPLGRHALGRLSPVQTLHHLYPALDDAQQRQWAVLETYDTLTDHHKHFRTPRQVRRMLEAAGLVDVEVWRGGNGVEARARRPEAGPARGAE